MISIKSLKKEYINSLKAFLDDINYHLILTIVLGESNYFTNPLPDYHFVKQELKKLDPELQQVFSFLLLGDRITKTILETALSIDTINYFCELDIIVCDDNNYFLNNYIITSYSNCYFLVSNVFYYPTCRDVVQRPYIGIDTYWLSRNIVNRTKGNVLDLCTGSGIQAILAAKNADHVVAVEIDTEAVKIAYFNIILNNVEDKVEIRNGDLYDVVKQNEIFDFIISNPPFIPIPNGVNFPVCGDGGEDGQYILKQILEKLTVHLADCGYAIIIGQGIGNRNQLFIENNIKKYLSDLNTTLIVNGKIPINIQAMGFATLSSQYNNSDLSAERWNDIYRNLSAEYFYTFTLFVSKSKKKNKKIIIDDSWNKSDVPILNISKIIEDTPNYRVYYENSTKIMDEETVFFLKNIDGKTDLANLISKIPFKYKVKYGINNLDNMLLKYVSLCSSLERCGVLKKANFKE